MSITRYGSWIKPTSVLPDGSQWGEEILSEPDPDGRWVKYKDHATEFAVLEDRLVELAGEYEKEIKDLETVACKLHEITTWLKSHPEIEHLIYQEILTSREVHAINFASDQDATAAGKYVTETYSEALR
jgi:hypothetical protein